MHCINTDTLGWLANFAKRRPRVLQIFRERFEAVICERCLKSCSKTLNGIVPMYAGPLSFKLFISLCTRSTSRSLQRKTFTPPTVRSFGAFIQFPSAMQRRSVIRLTPSLFAASRDEQAFIVTDL